MDILRTGAIDCSHKPGECRACDHRLERRCRAPQQELVTEQCNCPRLPSCDYSATGRVRVDREGVMSHDCPIHGRDLGG
jgi:hypothetical protein